MGHGVRGDKAMIPETSPEITIDELDLSVRSFNCLKRAGIDTLSDLFNRLDEGISACFRIRNLGKKSLDEVLRKAQEKGYPADKAVERYIAELRQDPETTDEKVQSWESLRDALRQIVPEYTLDFEVHEGRPLESLENMPGFISHRLASQGIVTVEELLKQHTNEDELPMPKNAKWRLLRILDQHGYRFSDCTREQWPDILDYIEHKRASEFSIETLELPDSIEETLKTAGITVLKIVNENWLFLKEYLTNREIAILLYSLNEYGFRTKDANKEDYPGLSEFISANIEIAVSDLGLSPRIYHSLHQRSIDTLAQLQALSRQQLIENKIVGVTAMKELTRVLKDNHVHLVGDKIYTCAKCNTEFAAAEEPGDEHYCDDCTERLKRVKKIKDYLVTIDGPDYGSYTDGTRGFTIFATVHNKTKKMVEVKLRDFMIFCNNRQWASTSYLTGYNFVSEHIMPESSKTAAKIWSGIVWRDKRLADGDYVNFTIAIKDKVYSYKFVMKSGKFEIDDYFVY